MARPRITAVVLTLNEGRHIDACLASLAWADEVVVFDSYSADDTVRLAEGRGARVMQHAFVNFADQRNAALERIDAEWVFFVDADERAPPALAEEARRAVEDPAVAGWWIPRRNYIVGRWIQHAGWYPDHQLRLMRRDRARYDPAREVHEVVQLDGPAGYLENPLIHYNYDTWGQFVSKQRRYLKLEAGIQYQSGVRPRPWTFVTQPLREFTRRYVRLRGYKDGLHGLLLSVLMAYTTFLTTLEVARLCRRAGAP